MWLHKIGILYMVHTYYETGSASDFTKLTENDEKIMP